MKMYKNSKGASLEQFCKMGHFDPKCFGTLAFRKGVQTPQGNIVLSNSAKWVILAQIVLLALGLRKCIKTVREHRLRNSAKWAILAQIFLLPWGYENV